LASETRPVVAAFDVDGTLTTRDCVAPFLRRVAGYRLPIALLRHPARLARALLRRDVDAVKALACASVRGLEASVLAREGEAFARHVHEAWLRSDTVARLERHRALGHGVVLVSASLDPYLTPLGALLGVDGVVCTRLEVGADGLATGALEVANCRGPEKERRLRAWLEDQGLADAELWAYGDSTGDAELLRMADHSQRVDGVILPVELADI
jgi:phosphatidylglycerophosphatase C